jgi:AraC-like DNA-binding protein/quercetin dioxygenase-like cupin family protein
MFPFSVSKKLAQHDDHQFISIHEGTGYELVTFDKEQVNIFAAQVRCCEPHWHNASELIYILQGGFAVTVNQQTVQLTQGGMIYINRDDIHSLEATETNSRLLTVQFSSNLFDEINHGLLINYGVPNGLSCSSQDLQIKHHFIELVKHSLTHSDIVSFYKMSLIYKLLSDLELAGKEINDASQLSIRNKDEQLIKQSIEYINYHYSEDINLSQLAEQAGVSYHYFSKLFKKVSGYNFKEYLTFARINKAKFLLINTQTPITDISHSCGFTEHKHLISAFKKYCLMTPTEFRKYYISGINNHNPSNMMTNFHCIELTAEMLDEITDS